jgi:hypothetical protein
MNFAIVSEQLDVGDALIEYQTFQRSARCERERRAYRSRAVARTERAQEANEIGDFGVGEIR